MAHLLMQGATKPAGDAVQDNSFLWQASAPVRKSSVFDEAQQAGDAVQETSSPSKTSASLRKSPAFDEAQPTGDAVQRSCSPFKALAPLSKSSVFDEAQQESINNKVDHSEQGCCPRPAQISG